MHGRTPLVGRSAELETLARLLDRSAASMRVAVVPGEPGIGKTRLLEETAALAGRGGRPVRFGRATEIDRDTPFAPVMDAFHAFDDAERSRIAALRSDQRDQLAAVFPALADLGEPRVDGTHRYHALHAIRRMLETLARRLPLALLLDDLHWADQATLELVAYLLRRPPDAPLTLVLAYRPAELSRELHGALDGAGLSVEPVRLGLGPLSREQADGLIGAGVGRDLRTSLYRESGGNPFYLEQLVMAAGRGRAHTGLEADPRLPGVPTAVRRALAGELELLPADARLAARAAAVLGETFSPDTAAAVAQLDADAAAAALDQLVEADLVRPTGSPALRFRHPIVRRAIYEDAPPAWRTIAHGRADAALAAQGAPALQRAPHVERSATVGDRAAIGVLVEAGRAGSRHAPMIAARWFEAARRLLPEGGSADELPLLVMLGLCLGMGGELRRSRDVLGEALEHLRAAGAPERGAVVAFTAGIDHFLGRHDEARQLLEEAVREAPADSVDAAAMLTELAWDRWFRSDWHGMAEDAAAARDVARRAGDPALEANAAAFVALAEGATLGDAAAEPPLRAAAAIVDGLADDVLGRRVMTLFALGVACGQLEDYAAANRYMLRGARLAERTGQESLLVMMEAGVALSAVHLGELEDARRHVAVALEIARIYDLDHLQGWAQMIQTLWALRAGELAEAAAAGARAEAAFAALGLPPPASMCCWCAEVWVESGRAAEVSEWLLDICGGPDMPSLQPAYRAYAAAVLAQAALALGATEEAALWAERAQRVSRGQAVYGTANALRARAAVALADGRPGEAAELALASAQAAASRSAAVEALRSRVLAGEALARAGERDRAVAELVAAHREASERGAQRLRDEAAAHLRGLGERVGRPGRRPRRGSGLDALSPREREVAELVTERLTNREIAERLVLSPKTVERHLARIYEALDISSRVELARRVEDARPAARQ